MESDWLVAYHEAGHALVGMRYGYVDSAKLAYDAGETAVAMRAPEDGPTGAAFIRVKLAGIAAVQSRLEPFHLSVHPDAITGADDDIDSVTELWGLGRPSALGWYRWQFGSKQQKDAYEQMARVIEELCKEFRNENALGSDLVDLAAELHGKRTVSGARVARIVQTRPARNLRRGVMWWVANLAFYAVLMLAYAVLSKLLGCEH